MKVCGLNEGRVVGLIKTDNNAILDGRIENNYDAANTYFMKINTLI